MTSERGKNFHFENEIGIQITGNGRIVKKTLLKYEAEAKGIRQVLESKAAGYSDLVKSCENDAKSAATLLMIEKIEQ